MYKIIIKDTQPLEADMYNTEWCYDGIVFRMGSSSPADGEQHASTIRRS